MATKTTNDASLQSTKQMLDELDALMEKMLSLPVNDPDDASPFPNAVVKPPTLTPTLSATLTLLEPPTPSRPVAPPSDYLPLLETTPTNPAVNPPHLTLPASKPVRPQPYEPAPQPAPLTNEVMPPSVLQKLEPLLAEMPEASTPLTTQWVYLPLLWINQGFDGATTMLGSLGSLLRSQAGRTLLGLSGIAMLVTAVAWFVKDWLGWN